nr:hypothetical protein [uncultured Chitinophaga sp.]
MKDETAESMTIEKEPKASAIYGSRAANGVVIIVIKDAIARKEYKKLKPYLSGL